ncbi:MAG TPA: SpoIIE family protein phosphatase [Candidatus Brocadiia bacterium]|nr:SpoIIE family protein phosphatase [Candidatus Brocadiia bacterium]
MTDCSSPNSKRSREKANIAKAALDSLRDEISSMKQEIARLRQENAGLKSEMDAHETEARLARSAPDAPCDEHALLRARYDRDLQIARQLQLRLNPVWLPQMPGMEIAVKCVSGAKASGDFYDVIELGDNSYGLLIADVSGSGLRAAVVMAVAKLAFRTFSANQFSPKAILDKVNAALCDSTPESYYLEAFLGVLDADNMVLRYVNASQPPPLLLRDKVTRLDGRGLFVGMFDDPGYEEKTVALEFGDRLLMLTDGALDRFGPPGAARDARIDEVLTANRNASLEDMVELLLQVPPAPGYFEEGDDLTILALEVAQSPVAVHELSIESDPAEIRHVERLILGLLETKGYGERSLFATRLALEEAVTNAIRHGNKHDRTRKVHVTFFLEDDRATITVADEGEGFNPSEVPDPRGVEYLEREGGRGLLLMRAYMDEVSYNDKGNAVTMVKYAPWARKKSPGG